MGLGLAFLLFVQAVVASIGFGMEAARGGEGFAICSAISAGPKASPSNEGKQPSQHSPHCPFCYVAAQSAGQIATLGRAQAQLAYVVFDSGDAIYGRFIDRIFSLPLRRRANDPRGPPNISV